jgi:hypothetical protein
MAKRDKKRKRKNNRGEWNLMRPLFAGDLPTPDPLADSGVHPAERNCAVSSRKREAAKHLHF